LKGFLLTRDESADRSDPTFLFLESTWNSVQMKEATTHADLCDEVEYMQQWRTYQHMADRNLITCDCLLHQENVCETPHNDECCQMASELL
jgi:hypothetical protein